MFGDDDPEDGWDRGDPVLVRAARLRLIVDSIVAEHAAVGLTARVAARRYGTLSDLLALLALRSLPADVRSELDALHDRVEAVT